MRKSLIAVGLVAALHGQAVAAPASPSSIEELLTVTHTESLMDAMYASVEQNMRQWTQQALQGEKLTPEQSKVLEGMPARLLAVVREEFNWAKMKPLYVQIYQESFEQDEIDGLISFYKSPAGRAFIDKMPLVMQKSVAVSQRQMQTLMPKMKAAMDQAMTEAKAAK